MILIIFFFRGDHTHSPPTKIVTITLFSPLMLKYAKAHLT